MPALDTRQKFRLVLAGLLGLILLIGMVAVWQLGRLGSAVDVVMRENFRTVLAMEEFEQALERMDSGALLAVSGDLERGRRLVAVHEEFARRTLATELDNITIPGERERAEALQAEYVEYRESLRELMREGLSDEERRSLYFDRVNPEFDQLKRQADELIEMNRDAMAAANEAARDRADDSRLALLLLVFIAAWIAFYIASMVLELPMRPIRHLDAYLRGVETAEDLPEAWEESEEMSRLVDAIGEVRERRGDRSAQS
ncbi:MAG: hypothetical protein R3326_03065 [Gemmatimonadota bacterium]|nr:hypothetical protein [Gemmatimonadota bacterium]